MLITILEWSAFGLSLLCVYLYGERPRTAPIVGMACAWVFMVWGFLSGVPAAVVTNVVFFLLHMRNFYLMWLK
jgi:hypothetical protein